MNVGRLTKYQAQMVSSLHISREILGRYHDSTWLLSCGTRSPFGHILWGVAFTDTGWMWTSMFWEQDIYDYIWIVDVCTCSCSIRLTFKYVIQIYFYHAKQMRRFALYHEPTALLALCFVLWVEFAGVVDTSRTLKSYVIAGTSRLQSCRNFGYKSCH